MAQILVRDLEQTIVNKLKKQAKRNGRSLQSEVKQILAQAAVEEKVDKQTARAMVLEIRKMFRGRKFPDTVELIHEGRER